jgi:serine/threonine protein kinase
MNENFECDLYSTEDDTIKNCSNIEIEFIDFEHPLGSGMSGTVYPAVVNFGSKKIVLILKKISTTVKTKAQENNFIDDMHDEVDYSYEMGKNHVGPRVYDAFFYQSGNVMNQFILMEKFDTSVANWVLSNDLSLTYANCIFVTNQMLELLHRQIFVLDTYCGDIKTDNFVINFNPPVVRMIDFGIDWCSSSKLPKAYSKVNSIKRLSSIVKKEIFYCMCTLQLFMNIINIGTPVNVIRMVLRPFYNDDIFIKYVLEDALYKRLLFDKPDITKIKRIKRRSKKIGKTNFRNIFKDMLEYGHDQAILLAHYTKQNKTQTSSQIVDYVFNKIKEVSVIFKK